MVTMTGLSERVESRIVKLEERGFDLTSARALLSAAEAEVARAYIKIGSIEGEVTAALDTDSPREAFGAVRELFGEVKNSVKAAHRALVEAIKAVKAGVGTPTVEAEDEGEGEGE